MGTWMSQASGAFSVSVARTGRDGDTCASSTQLEQPLSFLPTPPQARGPETQPYSLPQLTWAFPALCLLGTVTLATPRHQNAAFLQADGRICANAPASLDSRKNS